MVNSAIMTRYAKNVMIVHTTRDHASEMEDHVMTDGPITMMMIEEIDARGKMIGEGRESMMTGIENGTISEETIDVIVPRDEIPVILMTMMRTIGGLLLLLDVVAGMIMIKVR